MSLIKTQNRHSFIGGIILSFVVAGLSFGAIAVAKSYTTERLLPQTKIEAPVNSIDLADFLGPGVNYNARNVGECAEENQVKDFGYFRDSSITMDIKSAYDYETGIADNVEERGKDGIDRVISGDIKFVVGFTRSLGGDNVKIIGDAENVDRNFAGFEGWLYGRLYRSAGEGDRPDGALFVKDLDGNGRIGCYNPVSGRVTWDAGDERFITSDVLVGPNQIRGDTSQFPWFSSSGGGTSHTIIPHLIIDKYVAPICGDVNGDGKVLTSDALAVLYKAVGKDVELDCRCGDPNSLCGDVNGDGQILVSDAQAILYKAVGKDVELSCGCQL